jgi:hypothetical protein
MIGPVSVKDCCPKLHPARRRAVIAVGVRWLDKTAKQLPTASLIGKSGRNIK